MSLLAACRRNFDHRKFETKAIEKQPHHIGVIVKRVMAGKDFGSQLSCIVALHSGPH